MDQHTPMFPPAAGRVRIGYLVVIVVTAAVTWGIVALLANIARHKAEAERVVFQLVELDETTVDPVLEPHHLFAAKNESAFGSDRGAVSEVVHSCIVSTAVIDQ